MKNPKDQSFNWAGLKHWSVWGQMNRDLSSAWTAGVSHGSWSFSFSFVSCNLSSFKNVPYLLSAISLHVSLSFMKDFILTFNRKSCWTRFYFFLVAGLKNKKKRKENIQNITNKSISVAIISLGIFSFPSKFHVY